MALAQVDYFDLRYDQHNRSPVLLLKDAETDKFLPVWIGELEASSIELARSNQQAPRPLTHDLFVNVLHDLGVRLDKIVIDRLERSTYYATVFLESDGRILEIDSRPSDAIALALRENVEIFVDDELMFNIKFVELSEQGEEGSTADEEPATQRVAGPENAEQDFQEFLKRIAPTDFKDN